MISFPSFILPKQYFPVIWEYINDNCTGHIIFLFWLKLCRDFFHLPFGIEDSEMKPKKQQQWQILVNLLNVKVKERILKTI